jgi:hypothetical protein
MKKTSNPFSWIIGIDMRSSGTIKYGYGTKTLLLHVKCSEVLLKRKSARQLDEYT